MTNDATQDDVLEGNEVHRLSTRGLFVRKNSRNNIIQTYISSRWFELSFVAFVMALLLCHSDAKSTNINDVSQASFQKKPTQVVFNQDKTNKKLFNYERNHQRGGATISKASKVSKPTTILGVGVRQTSKPSQQIVTSPTNTVVTSNQRSQPISIKKNQNTTKSSKEDPGIMFLMRLLFLTYYGSLGSLMPYLPVYYDSIGHGGQVIGLLGAVKPLTTFLVAPAWGILSDQIQRPFQILQVTFLVSLMGQLLVPIRNDATFLTIIIFITALFNAPVKSLLDSMVMDQLRDPSASYGRLRLWGQLGFGIGSSGVGMLLSKSSHKNSIVNWDDITARPWIQETVKIKMMQLTLEFVDKVWQSMSGYKLLFLVYGMLSIPTWIFIQVFQKSKKDTSTTNSNHNKTLATTSSKSKKTAMKNSVSTTEGLRLILKNADVMLFFFLVFVVGTSSGVIENFAYVRMREVGGTGKAMGLSRLVSSLAGAPMFWFSGPLTKALGADRVLILSLTSYVVRFLIYANMKNPYHGLPAEALRGITFAAFWSTGTVYAHRVSPPGMQATMLMFLNAMYGGLGQSLGSIIGGKLQHRFGTVRTFLYAAAFDSCFVALVVLYLSLSKENSTFKNPKPMESAS